MTDGVTWRASERNKFDLAFDWEYRCDCHRSVSPTLTPEASAIRTYHPKITALTWTFPATSRLLFEAGTATILLDYAPDPQRETPLFTIPVLEQNGNVQFLATPGDTTGSGGYGDKYNRIQNSRASMTYVTGSHAAKLGFQIRTGVKKFGEAGSPIDYRVLNGVPNQVTLFAYPLLFHENMRALLGVYGQDQWTLKRLTLGGGLRFDYENAYVPAQRLGPGAFVAARSYGEVDCVPCWKDLSPRASAAYDLFGDGKTAVKFSVGRFTAEEMLNTAHNSNPLLLSNASTNRPWDDYTYPVGDPRRGNYIPDCDLTSPARNGECGPNANPNFGNVVITNRYDSSVLTSHRPYNWSTSASVQHELMPGAAVSLGYFRASWHNFSVADAQDVTSADYDPFCIALPNNFLIPNGGQPLCGLYNIKPAQFGHDTSNLVTHIASGDYTDTYSGLDLTVNARLRRGAFVQGGMSTGAETTSSCTAVDSPSTSLSIVPLPAGFTASTPTAANANVNSTAFCSVSPPLWHPQFKFSGSYPLPFDFQASAVFQSIPGIPTLAPLVVPNAQVVGLGRALSGGVANVTVANILAPQTEFEERLNQIDVRFIRNFRFSNMRLRGTLDIYNVMNRSTVLAQVNQYGSSWRTPTSVLDARIFKVGVHMNF